MTCSLRLKSSTHVCRSELVELNCCGLAKTGNCNEMSIKIFMSKMSERGKKKDTIMVNEEMA